MRAEQLCVQKLFGLLDVYSSFFSLFKLTNLQAIDDVYNLSVKDRASQIRDRLKKDGIYEKRSANLKMNASLPILTKSSKKFKRKGQQDVGLRVLMWEAIQLEYTNTDIALEIRRYTFRGEYFDDTKRSNDKTYQNIMKKVSKYRKEYTEGKLDNVLQLEGRAKKEAMKSKTISVGARGRKPVSEQTDLERKLMVWLEDQWANERRVSRTMIFRQALVIDPSFKGGPKSTNFIERMKKWFYYGFAKRSYLSVRKLASVGQKLPPNWEATQA